MVTNHGMRTCLEAMGGVTTILRSLSSVSLLHLIDDLANQAASTVLGQEIVSLCRSCGTQLDGQWQHNGISLMPLSRA